jgi:hypothetical protein
MHKIMYLRPCRLKIIMRMLRTIIKPDRSMDLTKGPYPISGL